MRDITDALRWLREAEITLSHIQRSGYINGPDLNSARLQLVEALYSVEIAKREHGGSVAPFSSNEIRMNESLEDEDFRRIPAPRQSP